MFIAVFRLSKFALLGFAAIAEADARVDDGLPFERVLKVFVRDVDVGKDIEIGLPAEGRPGLFPVGRLFVQLADDLALFKMERILEAVAADGRVEILRGVLRGACAEAVEAEGVFIVAARVVVIFAAGVEFAKERISNAACSQPSRPSEPKMTAGRLRTRSAPLRDVMDSFP